MTARLAMRSRQDCRSRTPWRPAGHDNLLHEACIAGGDRSPYAPK